MASINFHRAPETVSDKLAYGLVKILRRVVDVFFKKRYIHRALVVETIAAVPGMVSAAIVHFRCLRTLGSDQGWIKKLFAEAENERMHLRVLLHFSRPTFLERLIIFFAQLFFISTYSLLYFFSKKTAHRFVGYLEEEAVKSYLTFLEEIDVGRIADLPAPEIAKQYWDLSENALLRDVILAILLDEAQHRDNNHRWADCLPIEASENS